MLFHRWPVGALARIADIISGDIVTGSRCQMPASSNASRYWIAAVNALMEIPTVRPSFQQDVCNMTERY